MSYKTILYEVEEGTATITLNRPERMNAVSRELIREMLAALEEVRHSDQVRVLIVTGAGRGFCSGSDISGPLEGWSGTRPLRSVVEMREGFHRLIHSLRRLDKPSIAAINGPAVAGGLTLALLCDLRIASDRARLGDGSLRFGFIPDEGATYFLPRAVGLEKALELILTGAILDAQEALRIGLVGRVVPHEELMKTVRELAHRIAQGPPIAQRLAKRAVYKQLDMDLDSALEDLALGAEIANNTQDAREGVLAFREKRPPQFQGR